MDKRLVIPPWKVELVRQYFSQVPGRKDKSHCAVLSPPPRGDPPQSMSMVVGETGEFPGFHDAEEGLSSCSITTSSPPARLRICRPKLISKMKNSQGEGKDDVSTSSSRSKPVPVQSRPKIILDKRKFPIKLMAQDQGTNCVSVTLKPVTANGPKLSERIRVLKDLSSKYPVKYEGNGLSESKRAAARLDFCFQSTTDAGLFFGKVNNLVRAQQKISVILFAERSLGRFGLIFLLFSVD